MTGFTVCCTFVCLLGKYKQSILRIVDVTLFWRKIPALTPTPTTQLSLKIFPKIHTFLKNVLPL